MNTNNQHNILRLIVYLFTGFFFIIIFHKKTLGQDCLQWGEKYSRNMISDVKNLPENFDLETGENINWVADLGSHGYATPIVANGKVLMGANNAAQYDKRHQGDRGTLLCFDEQSGELIWQLVVPRIEGDRHNDWPMIGICSPATVEGDKVYIMTNRSEILCLDINGQRNGNDGLFQGEGWFMAPSGEFAYEVTEKDADILWCYDMKLQLGMSPHDSPHSSILIDGDYLYLNTCSGVDYRHQQTRSLNAPNLIALNKHTGCLVAQDNENFGPRIFHSSWSSPSMGMVNGQKLVFFAGPDGIMYAFKALKNTTPDKIETFEKVWELDCDPSAPKENIHSYLKNRDVSPSGFLGMPVFYNDKIYVTVGGDIWWGKREAWLKCLNAGNGEEIWSAKLEKHSAATPSISNGLVYVTDCGNNIQCFDAESGKFHWKHKMERDSWSSTLAADSKIFTGTRGGDFWIIEDSKQMKVIHKAKFPRPIHSTPIAANGVLYVATMNKLYAIEEKD